MKDMLAWLVATFYLVISVSDKPSLSSPSEKTTLLDTLLATGQDGY